MIILNDNANAHDVFILYLFLLRIGYNMKGY